MRQFNISLFLLIGVGSLAAAHLAQAQQVETQQVETQQIETQQIETQQIETQQAATLTVEVTNLRNQDGNVCFKLFSGSEGFPNDDENALQRTCVAIANPEVSSDPAIDAAGSTESSQPSNAPTEPSSEPMAEPLDPSDQPSDTGFRYTFENLPVGNYAVAIYHDRNGDERLNRSLFGIPSEGYGFSNDAPANFGPADYDDAVFALEETDSTIQIRMRYP